MSPDNVEPVETEARDGTDLEAIASLAEPVRQNLYQFVASSSDPVGRDEAAEGVGVSRQVAAYHLDRLAEDGLLNVEFRRLSGRDGPGAGRPSKLYLRSDRSYHVSVPARRYDLAAQILLKAVRTADINDSDLMEVARSTGRGMGASGLEDALEATGYEPVDEEGETRFRNCPFHALRDQDRETTCGLNLALVEGIVEGAGSGLKAKLVPSDEYCCVRLQPV